MYLWHLPVLWGLKLHGWSAEATAVGYLINLTLTTALVITLSTITYRLVERPALAFKSKKSAVKRQAKSPQ